MKFIPATALLILLLASRILSGCQTDRDEMRAAQIVEGERIAVEDPWARPGSEGRMSAGYLLITNFEDEPDTLTGISSNIARYTEIHESLENESDMVGMQEVEDLVIPAQSTVSFEPGGIHIMFIQLNESLTDGEEIELILHFSNTGDLLVSMPVRS